MGYSADMIEEDAEFRIPADKLDALLADLKALEEISWITDLAGAEHAADVLEAYGYLTTIEDGGDLIIETWGGDKLGMSHDDVIGVLAKYAPKVNQVWLGEDSSRWMYAFDGEGHVTEHPAVILYPKPDLVARAEEVLAAWDSARSGDSWDAEHDAGNDLADILGELLRVVQGQDAHYCKTCGADVRISTASGKPTHMPPWGEHEEPIVVGVR